MVVNSNNHLSSLLLRQRVKCAAKHIDIKVIRCKGESPKSYQKGIEHISDKKVLADSLTKGLPPSVFREHTVDMGLWYSL
jgi:hypothetical protein